MLISLLLTLEADRSGVLPSHVGRANYAVILERLNEVASGLGDAIHALEGAKPLTCSGLFATGRQIGGEQRAGCQADFQTVMHAGSRFKIHITGLTTEVSNALSKAFLERPPGIWSVSGYTFRVVKILCDEAIDPWTGCTSYKTLAAKPILAGRPFTPQVTLAFLSPTSFQSNNLHMPLPLPDLVFGSLADRWNHFSPRIKMPAGLRTLLGERLAISQYELRSQAVQQKSGADGHGPGPRSLHIGAEGIVTYTLTGKASDPQQFVELTGRLYTLANFALYSGVGVKTTTGMGQCRRVLRE